jgi:squalene cyclase
MDLEYAHRLRLSLDRAYKFIKDSRNSGGLWSDFLTLAGESVYWVSGYIGYALSCYDRKDEEEWLKRIGYGILEQQKENGGWGYGPRVPADADSTSWCLLFLSKIGIQSNDSRNRALLFLLSHQNHLDGGFRTYAMPHEVGLYMMLDESISFEGWASSHLCVTGVAVQALVETCSTQGINQALDCIRKSQTIEGYWNAYWWSEKLYSTINCMNALKSQTSKEDVELLRKGQDWIVRTQLDDGGWNNSTTTQSIPFSTALGIRGLMIAPRPNFLENVKRGIEWLLSHQLADGSWNSHYILRIPHPSLKEPWSQTDWKQGGKAINALIKDHRRLYTTATVFKALTEFEKFSRG